MVDRYIYPDRGQRERYYYFDTYESYNDAYSVGRYYKRKNKSKYWIVKVEVGALFPRIRYRLYLSRIVRFMW